jgi:2-oxoglutarate dehydrogenase E2 component (dihydrolipoamide succinyltransferase)
MSFAEMVMPKMGESIIEATILKWLKKPGDMVKKDESVLEVATDKVDTEVPSLVAGTLGQVLFKEGDVVAIGKTIALIETDASTVPHAEQIPHNIAQVPMVAAPVENKAVSSAILAHKTDSDRFYSPLVINIARQEGVSFSELDTIVGTGREYRVTKADIMNYLERRKTVSSNGVHVADKPSPEVFVSSLEPKEMPSKASFVEKPATSFSGAREIIEMDRMRKLIAERMLESKRISPHVTSFVEADVTNLMTWRNKMKKEFMEKEGDALTVTPIFIEALAKALKDFPMVNASVEGDKIIVKKDINIGMAVALSNGNLIVPVIKNADQYNMVGLTKRVNDIVKRARVNQLNPDEVTGGTYTMSNVGTFGNLMGTPIIVQPQIAIMAFGVVQKKPAVIETPEGDSLGIRQMMFLSHSYDHRVVDGALGGMFVRKVADYLEGFDVSRGLH